MKSKKININELKVKSFITSLYDSNDLKTNMIKGGTSEDLTQYTRQRGGDCYHLITE